MTTKGQLPEGYAGLHQRHVGGDMLMGDAVIILHFPGRLPIPEEPGPGDIGADAIAPDEVGIKGEDFVILDNPGAAFLEPRVGAGA